MVNAMEVSSKSLVATPSTEAYGGPLHAFGRLLSVCATGRQEMCKLPANAGSHSVAVAPAAATAAPVVACREVVGPGLSDLVEGPYLHIVMLLDATSLGHMDAACRVMREMNRAPGGPWCALGATNFFGLELDGEGLFEEADAQPEDDTTPPGASSSPEPMLDDGGASAATSSSGGRGRHPGGELVATARSGWSTDRRTAQFDWKGRYARFCAEVPTFRAPFGSSEITEVQQADEIAYCRCRLRTDLLGAASTSDVYLEVEVFTNPDNVSLAVVDFEAGGCSSVTFSPDTGAVIRERKVCELPRRVEGAYIQPLSTITPGRGFEGSMGIYLQGGHLAFFRRHAVAVDGKEPEVGPWETTGFVTDLRWAEGRRLSPCLAFRNEGTYCVRTTRVGSQPPVRPERSAMAYEEASWNGLDWDADQQDAAEM